MFKVGDKVICKVHGEGVVTEVEATPPYRIEVDFLGGEWECYTSDGKWNFNDIEPSLSVIEE